MIINFHFQRYARNSYDVTDTLSEIERSIDHSDRPTTHWRTLFIPACFEALVDPDSSLMLFEKDGVPNYIVKELMVSFRIEDSTDYQSVVEYLKSKYDKHGVTIVECIDSELIREPL